MNYAIISHGHMSAPVSFAQTSSIHFMQWAQGLFLLYFQVVLEDVIVYVGEDGGRNQEIKSEQCALLGVEQSNGLIHSYRRRAFLFQIHRDGMWSLGRQGWERQERMKESGR